MLIPITPNDRNHIVDLFGDEYGNQYGDDPTLRVLPAERLEELVDYFDILITK